MSTVVYTALYRVGQVPRRAILPFVSCCNQTVMNPASDNGCTQHINGGAVLIGRSSETCLPLEVYWGTWNINNLSMALPLIFRGSCFLSMILEQSYCILGFRHLSDELPGKCSDPHGVEVSRRGRFVGPQATEHLAKTRLSQK